MTGALPSGWIFLSSGGARRESGSRDYFVLARIALESAIRNEDDVARATSIG